MVDPGVTPVTLLGARYLPLPLPIPPHLSTSAPLYLSVTILFLRLFLAVLASTSPKTIARDGTRS